MVWLSKFMEVVARASMARIWSAMILTMMEDGGDDVVVAV
jgi:hypothetical protein